MYTVEDFSETLSYTSTLSDGIQRVLWAWGYSPDGYASWAGGFMLAMDDGRYVLITGWCDTSGWGCNGGADVREQPSGDADVPTEYADYLPADLNTYLGCAA